MVSTHPVSVFHTTIVSLLNVLSIYCEVWGKWCQQGLLYGLCKQLNFCLGGSFNVCPGCF